MAQHNAAQGVTSSEGNASARLNRVDGTAPTLTEEIRQLVGKLPPNGHSQKLLAFWLERHLLEEQLRLQHHVGDLVDVHHPLCPVAVSLQVDCLTMRLDRVNRLLLPLLAPRGGGRHG